MANILIACDRGRFTIVAVIRTNILGFQVKGDQVIAEVGGNLNSFYCLLWSTWCWKNGTIK